MALDPGMIREERFIVDESLTAAAYGGQRLAPVLSTPHMIAFMEGTAHKLVLEHIAPGQSSVGSLVNIRHLAATPVGMGVRVRAELVEVDGRRLRFLVKAWDDMDKIAEGEHERFIIDWERFMAGVARKVDAAGR